MRKLVVGTFLTLDGVMQAPGGPEEDRSGGFVAAADLLGEGAAGLNRRTRPARCRDDVHPDS